MNAGDRESAIKAVLAAAKSAAADSPELIVIARRP
jgi:hypothetical protein